MDNHRQRSLRMKKILLAGVFAAICISIVFAALQKSDWTVPEEAKRVKNPLAPSDAALKSAAVLYRDNCGQCHGETGEGDGPEGMMYQPPPANLTDAKRMNALTDGEIFYKVSEGRKPMPAFKKKLGKEQRWQLVLFVRSFAGKTAGSGGKSGATNPQ
jgi:mono/diheme cytochrome c family protein